MQTAELRETFDARIPTLETPDDQELLFLRASIAEMTRKKTRRSMTRRNENRMTVETEQGEPLDEIDRAIADHREKTGQTIDRATAIIWMTQFTIIDENTRKDRFGRIVPRNKI